MNSIPQITKAELTYRLKALGYSVKKAGDEYEVYPKGKRGALSYFTSDAWDAYTTARTLAASAFADALAHLPITPEIADALRQWHMAHGVEWLEELQRAWYNGNYGRFNHDNVSSYLQKLRNTNGREVLSMITANL